MQINMKPYYLDTFKDKDLYTWDEIIDKIQELESELFEANEKIEKLENRDPGAEEYDRCEDDYRLGLL